METLKFIGGSSAIVDVDFIFGAMRVQPRAGRGMMMMWRCLAQGLNQAVPPSRASRQRKRQPMVLVRY